MSQKLYNMKFVAVYLALLAKVERKGGRAESVHQVTSWLTGYEVSDILTCLNKDLTDGDFFRQAPSYAPERIAITGKICGVSIEEIDDPLLQEIRRLDKLVDWLAKGKTSQQVLEKYEKSI
ncbi:MULTISPECIES: DUF2200 family protein [unclassified Streptococcus]|uniref:DUF2200 family protein n=1 Tax=unclassified Streptococcus TaxID=2608887 RepID=UPI0015625F95|nr:MULTISPECIES: DUF2200 family protein [unclassified Streptococcus]